MKTTLSSRAPSFGVHQYQHKDMDKKMAPRLFGWPVARIIATANGELVGYLYEWDNGDRQPAWLAGAVADVRYEPLEH